MGIRRTGLACLLVAVYVAVPFATLASDNRSFVSPGQILEPLLLVAAVPLVTVLLIGWRRGSHAALQLAAPVAVAVLVIFDYRELREPLYALTRHVLISTVFLWAVLLGVSVAVTLRLVSRHPRLPLYMLGAGVLMLAPPAMGYANFELRAGAAPVNAATDPGTLRLKGHGAPNVYFFLVDAHGRPDRLKPRFGFDESALLAQMRSAGYVVPRRSRTAYGITALSVPSILQADYVAGPGRVDFTRMDPMMAGRNFVVESFRKLGYKYALAPSNFGRWSCRGMEDICIKPSSVAPEIGVSDFNWAVIERTPLADVLRRVLPSGPGGFGRARQFPSRVVGSVLRHRDQRPIFTFAHVLLSHPPYLYRGPNCQFQPTVANEGDEGDAAYVGALQCTDAEISKAVRELSAEDPHAIVIFASDHGSDVDAPHYRPEWDWTNELLRRRFSNFLALHLPSGCRRNVPDDIVSVDIFRVVINCISAANMPLLPERRYLVDQPDGVIRAFDQARGY